MLPECCDTICSGIDFRVASEPERIWLRDVAQARFRDWSWREAREEFNAVAAWLQQTVPQSGAHCAVLSPNRAHWVLADMAIVASGGATVPLFTTLPAATAQYILEFARVKVLFVGEASNWDQVRCVLPADILIVTLPGVEVREEHVRWEDILRAHRGQRSTHVATPDELMSIVFTSGTTGEPKGVMHNHHSMLLPMRRCADAFSMAEHPRFLSYLPLSHVAERQAVLMQSVLHGGTITFNEGPDFLLRDLVGCRPTFFFGAPRIWEQLRQQIEADFGSAQALEEALARDPQGTVLRARTLVGLDEARYLLTGAAPAYEDLINWWARLGLSLMDGYGMTEAMGLIGSTAQNTRRGSIGKPVPGVEVRLSDSGELLCRADGMALGYYRREDETAATFVDGWVHTGDRARVDGDGFYYITGRMKDYFKTIHGKYVAPAPIEGRFSECSCVDQLCLLGRGYSKTVMVCVLSPVALTQARSATEAALIAQVGVVNSELERHARIGAVIVAGEPWSIENGVLTATLKIRRAEVESRFAALAERLGREAAEQGRVLVNWAT